MHNTGKYFLHRPLLVFSMCCCHHGSNRFASKVCRIAHTDAVVEMVEEEGLVEELVDGSNTPIFHHSLGNRFQRVQWHGSADD